MGDLAHCHERRLFEWRLVGEDDEDWREVRALDAHTAAERAAEAYDSDAAGTMADGRPVEFEIRSAEGITLWSVWAEATMLYYPRRIAEVAHG